MLPKHNIPDWVARHNVEVVVAEENNAVPTPKGYRDRPGDMALGMGFDAARRIVDRLQVKEMTGRDFADLVVSLAYSFEGVLQEQYR